VGPDGALYVVDFYNQAVIHNDTRGPKHNGVNAAVRPDRDHYFARIWRVHHKQSRPVPVPNLAEANVNNLVAALESSSKAVRFTAHRLLWENPTPEVIAALQKIPLSKEVPPWLHRIWLMADSGNLPDFILTAALKDESAVIRKNALRVVALQTGEPSRQVKQAMLLNLRDPDARVQLEAIVALGSMPVDDATANALVKMYPSFTNAWAESAVAGVAVKNPSAFLNAALASEQPDDLRGLVTVLVEQAAAKAETNSDIAAALVFSAANAPAKADVLKAGIFETLAKSLKPQFAPQWSEQLRGSFESVLKASSPAVSASALPLISAWDKQGTMKSDVQNLVAQLLATLNDEKQPDDRRAQLAVSLLGVRSSNSEIVPTVAKLIGSSASPALQKRVIDALGSSADPSIGASFAAIYPRLSPEMQETLFAQIVKRRDWSLALVDSLEQKKIELASLNPAAVHRLRTHSDGAVAKRANEVIDSLRGPEVKEKEALIAKLAPEVEKPGNLENGKKAFTQNCAVCHRFNGEGKELAPDLTGMGVHGSHELLVHILDPNRMVEENYMAVSIETKDGESYDGILGRDTRASVLVRNATGDTEIKTADIKSRRQTGRSLMPEGFEALGAETLRDILGYMSGGESKYRVIDMKAAFNADTRKGLFQREESTSDTLEFKKFGAFKVDDVPFDVVNPTRTRTGNNIIVLKGGSGVAKRMPQKAQITNINTKASRLHFLGGVGGWMYPFGGEGTKDLPAAKVTVEYADGQREEFTLRNGVEFADWNGQPEVPGSKLVSGALTHGQVRAFSHDLARGGSIQSITLESFDNSVAPVFVAITAETGPAATKVASAAAASTVASDAMPAKPFAWEASTKVLLVGGGSSHEYQKFFNRADSATLKAAGFSVNYTEDGATTARELSYVPRVDVVVLSVNSPKWATAELRKALFDFVAAGKGVVLLHPGMWYNFNDWPEFNRVLVGGGSRGHDALGEFTVNVINKEHPITRGVTPSFKITDELYYMTPATDGTPIEVLAETSPSKKFQKPHPSVFVVKHPQARIAGIALGHDARAHDLPEYQKLLVNAVNWAAGK
jgi:putative heme-binding domain-containing protein